MKYLSLFLTFFPVLLFSQINIPERGVVFEDSSLPSIYVELSESDLSELLEPGNEWNNYLFPSTFIFDNGIIRDTLEEVGLRFRGNTSRNAAKKSFKLDFNEYVSGRKYHGVEKMNLNGEHNDPSISRSKTCWDILRNLDLAGSRVNHLNLYLNNEFMGLYINVEHIDEEFLHTYFGNNTGNLYKCIYPADLNYKGADPDAYKEEYWGRRAYQLKTNTELDDYSRLGEMIAILNNTPINDLECTFEEIFNVSNLLKYIAFDVLTGNWDGPHYNKNNFYLYDNPTTGKFEYISYDLDNTLGIDWLSKDWGNRNIYEWAQSGDTGRPLYNRILEVPAFRERYSFYLNEIIEEIFNEDFLYPYLDDMRELIASSVQNDEYFPLDYGFTYEDFYDSFDQDLNYFQTDYSIKEFISTRKNSALQQLELSNISPIISNVKNNFPNTNEDLIITAHVEDEENDLTVQFCYQIEGQTDVICETMLDDGMNEDEDANDKIYGIVLSELLEEGNLAYFIQAIDNQSNMSRIPACDEIEININLNDYPIVINELMANNLSTIYDGSGEAEDWIELYNKGTQTIYLGDLFLSDEEGFPMKWELPNVNLAPDNYYLIWADKDEEEGENHANFKLSAGGEELSLFTAENGSLTLLEKIDFPALDVDVAYARVPNGVGAFDYQFATPNWNNDLETSVYNFDIQDNYSIYPNPNSGSFYIEFNDLSNEYLIEIVNSLGEIVFKKDRISNNERIDISNEERGIYFVKIIQGTQVIGIEKLKILK